MWVGAKYGPVVEENGLKMATGIYVDDKGGTKPFKFLVSDVLEKQVAAEIVRMNAQDALADTIPPEGTDVPPPVVVDTTARDAWVAKVQRLYMLNRLVDNQIDFVVERDALIKEVNAEKDIAFLDRVMI